MIFHNNLVILERLSQVSNAVLMPEKNIRVTHYKPNPRKENHFVMPLNKTEKKERKAWCKDQVEYLRNTESSAVMSFLLKEHN